MMQDLSPRQLVQALDRHIVGQEDAKRAVAVAVRNRWRRLRLPPEIARDVAPKNILMMGPTGVGKTEIARRLAQLVEAPFLKIEATKFTEVGYVGRDVESIIRDLVERAVSLQREAMAAHVRAEAQTAAQERVLDQLLPHSEPAGSEDAEAGERRRRTREKLRGQLEAGHFAEKSIEVTIDEPSVSPMLLRVSGMEQMGPEMEHLFERMLPQRSRRQKLPLAKALEVFTQQEIDNRLDQEALNGAAVRRCEESGIVFIDEIDKICTTGNEFTGPDISRGGVQRDLLPLVEGTTVTTRYGPVKTDHILFIAAGAFTQSSPNDLMPEFIGRFPIRVRLDELTVEDYYRILTEPQNSLIQQQIALMSADGVNLHFNDDGIREMAEMADRANESLENVGARRLYTIVEKVCEDIAFHASEAANKDVVVDLEYVRLRLAGILDDEARAQFEF